MMVLSSFSVLPYQVQCHMSVPWLLLVIKGHLPFPQPIDYIESDVLYTNVGNNYQIELLKVTFCYFLAGVDYNMIQQRLVHTWLPEIINSRYTNYIVIARSSNPHTLLSVLGMDCAPRE